jgi:hypothetical protein
MRSTLLTTLATAAAALVLAACGGGDDDDPATTSSTTSTAATTGACSEIEEVDVESFGTHTDDDFTAADYETNPPTGGDHNDTPLQGGAFYTKPPRLGEAVHLLEHGAVIGWTNGLSASDQEEVEAAFNEIFDEGYYQLATIENPDLEVPFALSAWGALQTCEELDTSVIKPFVEEWYASPKSGESFLACEGEARRLPPC